MSSVPSGSPEAAIPQHHRAAAILALWNGPFEIAVVERVILDLDRQALVGGIEGGALASPPRT